MAEDQTTTPVKTRYSLRTRTPVKKEQPIETPMTRKRARSQKTTSVKKVSSRRSQRELKASETPSRSGKRRKSTRTTQISQVVKEKSTAAAAKPTRRRGRGKSISAVEATLSKTTRLQDKNDKEIETNTRNTSASAKGDGTTLNQDATDDEFGEADDVTDGLDAAEVSSEDEEYNPEKASNDDGVDIADISATRLKRSGPKESDRNNTKAKKRKGQNSRRASSSVPAKKTWELRRMAVHLTKHDPFRIEYLENATKTLESLPVDGTSYDDRYEMVKISDCLKMCGYELGALNNMETPVFNEIYMLLSWSFHSSGPHGSSHPAPPLSDEAKSILAKVFASIGSRIREETKDMAAYHRRHAARKLLLAQNSHLNANPEANNDNEGVASENNVNNDSGSTDLLLQTLGQESQHANGESSKDGRSGKASLVHRRNPLKIPNLLIDLWKDPYKKSAGSSQPKAAS